MLRPCAYCHRAGSTPYNLPSGHMALGSGAVHNEGSRNGPDRRCNMILVTGGAGFVGSHIIRRLVSEGERPRALVRQPEQAQERLPATGVEVVQGDTTRPETLDAAMQ